MHRFYIPLAAWNPDALALDEAESHHALNVLRLQEGEESSRLQRPRHRSDRADCPGIDQTRGALADAAQGQDTAPAVSDHAGAGRAQGQEHGSHRAEGDRTRRGGNRPVAVRTHRGADGRHRRRGGQASEMADDRDRGCQAVWSELVADGGFCRVRRKISSGRWHEGLTT